MKCYTDPKTTPLKFHKIFHRILLPLWILGTFVGAFRLLSYADYAAYFSVLTFVYLGAGAALVACFLGLGTWERYAWYSLMGVLSGMLLMRIVISSVNLQSGFSDISDFLGEWIGAFASYGLILLYYYKRRGLFFRPATARSAESVKAAKSHHNADSFANKSELLSPFRVVPPVLYAEPEAIPRKYSGSYYTFTGDTGKDVQALHSNYDHASSLVDFTMNRMDQVGNNPGNPKREELAHKFFAYQIAKSCYAHIIAAISQEAEPAAAKKLVDIQTRNVQFQFDYMCDLIRDFYMLQADLASSRNDPERQKSLEDQISALENNISDAQVQIFRIYRM